MCFRVVHGDCGFARLRTGVRRFLHTPATYSAANGAEAVHCVAYFCIIKILLYYLLFLLVTVRVPSGLVAHAHQIATSSTVSTWRMHTSLWLSLALV
jgi:hypothetical protein